MLDDDLIDAYLERIGAERPTRLDAAALATLQERHVLSVPFENLDYHLGREIHMDEAVIPKIVHERRGGGCYEVNPGLYHLLGALGFDVAMHPGSVWIDGVLGPPYCHVVVLARVAGATWLVDVGFGRTPRSPLPTASTETHDDPHGRFRLAPAEDGGTDVIADDAPQYRFYGAIDCCAADFRPTLWWYRTAPDSPFLQNVFCSMPTPDGRVTIKDDKATEVVGGNRTSERIPDEEALRARYREWFGFELAEVPTKAGTGEIDVRMSFE